MNMYTIDFTKQEHLNLFDIMDELGIGYTYFSSFKVDLSFFLKSPLYRQTCISERKNELETLKGEDKDYAAYLKML